MRRLESYTLVLVGWWRIALRTAIAAVAVVLAAAYLTALQGPSVGLFHDDGIYAVTARALAEGRGYRILSLPDTPPQTKYPILFPWLLSLVWRIAPAFPDNLPWLRAVPFLSMVAWLGLSWRLIQQCGASRATATVVVLLTAASPWTLFLGTSLLTETLFAALLTGMLMALMASTAAVRENLRLAALAGLLGGATLLTRAAGVAVVGAGLAWLLSKRKWSHAAVFAVVASAVVAPWGLWVLAQNQAVAESYYSASNYASWNIVFSYTWREKLDVLFGNLLFSALTPATLWGLPSTHANLVLSSLVAVALVVRGLWLTRRHVASWCVVSIGTMNLLWVWPPPRFYLPVVPLLLWHASVALRPVPRILVVTLTATIGAVGVVGTAQAVANAVAAEEWRRLAPLLEWIKRETRPTAIVTGTFDPIYFLVAERRAVRAFETDPYELAYASPDVGHYPLGTVEEFRQRILASRVDYCIWSPAKGLIETPHFRRLLDGLAEAYPGSLRVVAGREDSGYAIYFVDRVRLAHVASGPGD